jgi:hypothetical protein
MQMAQLTVPATALQLNAMARVRFNDDEECGTTGL